MPNMATPPPFLFDPACGAPVLLACPHSGRYYPPKLLHLSRLSLRVLRRCEDAYVDELVREGRASGCGLLRATHARAFLDLNRGPDELDAAMFFADPHHPVIPPKDPTAQDRIAAGLGVLPRTVGVGLDIYGRRLTWEEAKERLHTLHAPYHRALEQEVRRLASQHGAALLLDCHSMPSAAAQPHDGSRTPDIVLGDRFGTSASDDLRCLCLSALTDAGFRVVMNAPYAGGYTTARHGRPGRHVHGLQIEINRALYMDEATLHRRPDFAAVATALTQAIATIARTAAQRWPAPWATAAQ